MSKITKPLLASPVDLETLDFSKGYLASTKLDGIRSLTVGSKLMSRSFKPIQNAYARDYLESILPDGIDGELIVGDSKDPHAFNASSSGIMSRDGEPDFTYWVFDWVSSSLSMPFSERFEKLTQLVNSLNDPRVRLVGHEVVASEEELLALETKYLAQGFEGVMLRDPNGPYKCGRSSTREGYLLKLKRFQDAEAKVVGFEELMHNDNEAEEDAFGRTKRSSKKEGLRPAGMLGKLIVEDLTSGLTFGVGGGFTQLQRKDLWNIRESLPGKIITYKAQEAGTLDRPRFPIFLHFRDPKDM